MSKFGVHVATWNVGTKQPPNDLSALVGLPESEYVIDILAVGLQEVPWGLRTSSDALSRNNPWLLHLTKILGKSEFVLLTATQMCSTYLAIFVQRTILPFVSCVESAHTPTGFFGLFGSKGVVSTRFQLHGTWFSFVNSHLAAHAANSMTRIWEYDTIVDYHRYADHSKMLDHDYVFWFGDLNFRLDGVSREIINSAIEAKNYSELFEFDQLIRFQRDGLIFTDFEESGLYFAPTYKKKAGNATAATSVEDYIVCPKRLPSWCDRILYSSASFPYSIHVLDYADIPSLVTSDHTPVFLQANVAIPHPSSHSLVRFGPAICESMPTANSSPLILSCTFAFVASFKPSLNDKIAIYRKYFARLDEDVRRWSISEFLPLKAIRLDLVEELGKALEPGFYCFIYHHEFANSKYRVAGISDYFAVGDVASDEDDFGDEAGFVNEYEEDDGSCESSEDIELARNGISRIERPKSARRQRSIPPRPKSARGYYDDLSSTPGNASRSGSISNSLAATPSLPATAWSASPEMTEDQERAAQYTDHAPNLSFDTSLNESKLLDEELGIVDCDDFGEDVLDEDEEILDDDKDYEQLDRRLA